MESKQNNPKPQIVLTPNGPYFSFDIAPHPVRNLQNSKGEGYSRVLYNALCRCGSSKNKPFCSGRHWDIEFKADG